jgi:hypothetical protein
MSKSYIKNKFSEMVNLKEREDGEAYRSIQKRARGRGGKQLKRNNMIDKLCE